MKELFTYLPTVLLFWKFISWSNLTIFLSFRGDITYLILILCLKKCHQVINGKKAENRLQQNKLT